MSNTESKPCWINESLPAPEVSSYSTRGTWESIAELQTYVTGPQTSKRAIVVVYDIFGPTAQVLQGADRLAEHLDALVLMPDFFKGNAPSHEEFEKNPAKGMEAMKEFGKVYADLTTNTKVLSDLMPVVQTRFRTVDSWGVFGLCWGGKLAILAAIADDSPFKVSGQTHPGRLSADDARALKTPHICMPSKDEPEDVVVEYEKILAEKELGQVERFPTMFHGWMGARANLADKENLEAYQRGYRVAAEFFAKHL